MDGLNYCFAYAVVACCAGKLLIREIADSISSHERRFTMVAELNRSFSFEHVIFT